MEKLVNRPKVFLSHSSKDKSFINQLYDDLKRCKIDPWLDTEEIRDGRPWMKVIFEDGIPACDAVIVYLTENSIKSKMVRFRYWLNYHNLVTNDLSIRFVERIYK